MADTNAIAEKSKAGWNGFCRFLLFAITGIILALGLMAIFLL